MSLGKLVVDLSANTVSFEKAMTKAALLADVRASSIKRSFKVMGAALGTVAAGIAVEIKRIVNDADQLAKTSQKIGVTTEALSALRYSADLANVSFDQLTTGLGRLSRNASDAKSGIGASRKAFDALGVSVINTDKSLRGIDDIFSDISEKFSKMEDGTKKAALAQELFGRSGAELIPLLNEGKEGLEKMRQEAERLGIIIDTKTALQAERFNDNITRLKGSVSGLFLTMSKDTIPVLADFSDQAVENSKNIRGMDTASQNLASTLIALIGAGGVITSSFQTMGIVIGDTMAKISVLSKGLDLKNLLSPNPLSQATGFAKLAAEMKNKGAEMKAIDEQTSKDISAIWEKSNGDYMHLIEENAKRRKEIEEGVNDAAADSVANGVNKSIGSMQELARETTRTQNVMRDMGTTFTSSAEEAIISGEKLSDVIGGLAKDIERIMLRRMILEPLFNSIFGDAGLFSGSIPAKSVTASAKGNVFSSGQLLAFANGGVVKNRIQFPLSGGRQGIAGEAGPEAIMPLTRTPGGDLGVKAVGGGGGVEINIYAPPGSQVSKDQRMEGGINRIDIMIDEATAGNIRPGTKTYRAMRDTFGLGQKLTSR